MAGTPPRGRRNVLIPSETHWGDSVVRLPVSEGVGMLPIPVLVQLGHQPLLCLLLLRWGPLLPFGFCSFCLQENPKAVSITMATAWEAEPGENQRVQVRRTHHLQLLHLCLLLLQVFQNQV